MQLQITISPSEKLALRDPERSNLGRKIVRRGIVLMHELGYEHFTFKKLALAIQSTEAGIYRYFEHKHNMLLYFLTWYWNYMHYQVLAAVQNLDTPREKIKKIIEILNTRLPDHPDSTGIDQEALYQIVISESNKAYLTKEVDEINKHRLFKPYKDLCGQIAEVFLHYNPDYPYARSLASTLLEMSHLQPYFADHLPSLTDKLVYGNPEYIPAFLEHLVFATLDRE